MGASAGLDAQLGFAEETVYGTAVTVNRFFEYVKEGFKQDINRIESKAIRTGTRFQRGDRWRPGSKTVTGAPELEVLNKGFGVVFKHIFGGAPVITGPAGTLYTQTYTPQSLTALSLTAQVGRPDISGTVQPFTYEGCKIDTWEFSSAVDGILALKLGIVAEDEKSPVSTPAGPALATAAFPATAAMFTFIDGAITLAGSAFAVQKFSVKGDNGIAKSRRFIGSDIIKNPLEAAKRMVTGELEAEFIDTVAYGRFVAGTEAALVLNFAVTISTVTFSLAITMNVRFDGDTPTADDEGIVPDKIVFKATETPGGGPASAITLVYVTTDSAA